MLKVNNTFKYIKVELVATAATAATAHTHTPPSLFAEDSTLSLDVRIEFASVKSKWKRRVKRQLVGDIVGQVSSHDVAQPF